jgi:putative glutathione S-transferase
MWAYARELYQRPGIAETVAMDEIKTHYYTTHDSLNPKRIVPAGPLDLDWDAPHGRDQH